MEPTINVRNLEKSVNTKSGLLYLLRRINLEIEEGGFLSIMGPSGAGKSTLLNIIGMYDHPGRVSTISTANRSTNSHPRSEPRSISATLDSFSNSSICSMT
jgi:ABC-type lipoprotein export system ATPase subunit